MNWLLNNPISEMPRPTFLGLYAVVIALVLAEAVARSRRSDRSRDLGPHPIPNKPDPLEIAYLRGGENEAARLVVFDLLSRGYLRVQPAEKKGRGSESLIERDPGRPDPDGLSPAEADALAYFATTRKPGGLFGPGGLAPRLKPWLAPLAESLRERRLLRTGDRLAAAWRTWLGGAIMILAFGGFKLAVALAKGRHNVAFLLGFALVGLVVLGFLCVVPRVTGRGKDYLASLRDAFEGQMPRIPEDSPTPSRDPALVLFPAIFGIGALAGTPYAHVNDLFRKSAAPGGGCGGGCGGAASCGGGGGCGGGGCGGGCGGCGG